MLQGRCLKQPLLDCFQFDSRAPMRHKKPPLHADSDRSRHTSSRVQADQFASSEDFEADRAEFRVSDASRCWCLALCWLAGRSRWPVLSQPLYALLLLCPGIEVVDCPDQCQWQPLLMQPLLAVLAGRLVKVAGQIFPRHDICLVTDLSQDLLCPPTVCSSHC